MRKKSGSVVTAGSLRCRDCKMMEFSIQWKARRVRTVDFRRRGFGLLRDIVGKEKIILLFLKTENIHRNLLG